VAKTPSGPKIHFGATPRGGWCAPIAALLGHSQHPGGSLVGHGGHRRAASTPPDPKPPALGGAWGLQAGLAPLTTKR
jgi:hypothetical protein